jgi:hypothetical protein
MSTFNIEEYFKSLPDDIEEININNRNLNYIPTLERFKRLKIFNCSFNLITNLPDLPNTLIFLNCGYNQLTFLPRLPCALEHLYCSNNLLNSLPLLPLSLKVLYCSHNRLLSCLPNLSQNKLEKIYCYQNHLSNLPNLPKTLKELYCEYNQLTSLPDLPSALEILSCFNNRLNTLPILPKLLNKLYCIDNDLPFITIKEWYKFNLFKNTYYKIKYGSRLERYYIKNIRNRDIHKEMKELIFCPDYNFYKRFLNPDIVNMFA